MGCAGGLFRSQSETLRKDEVIRKKEEGVSVVERNR